MVYSKSGVTLQSVNLSVHTDLNLSALEPPLVLDLALDEPGGLANVDPPPVHLLEPPRHPLQVLTQVDQLCIPCHPFT